MKSEKQVKRMLRLIEDNEDFHHMVVKDVSLLEVKTAKEVLKWVLSD